MSDESYASDLGRTTAFSDGVFAIAITLLVLSLDVPEGLEGKQVSDFVGDEWPQFFAYFLSFAVIGRYWISHHAHFAMLRSVDARLVVINLAFLSFVCLIPFPTGLLGEFGDSTVAVVLYASVVGLASLLALAMIRYTRAHGMILTAAEPAAERMQRAMLGPPLVFLGSIPFAFVIPSQTPFIWLLLAVEGRLRR